MDKLTALIHLTHYYRIIIGIVLFYIIIIIPEHSFAQNNQRQDQATTENASSYVAPVIIDGKILFMLRGVTGYPAKVRVARIASTIKNIAADPEFKIEDLYTKENEFSSQIMAKNQMIFNLLDADAHLENISRKILAEAYTFRIQETIKEYRSARKISALWDLPGFHPTKIMHKFGSHPNLI